MKKFIKPVMFGVIFIVCLFAINTGCKKKAECSGVQGLCDSHTYTACCTDTDCYYLVDDSDKFSCNGLDCGAAASTMINKYCFGGATGFTEKQALEAVARVLNTVN
jgi:hypothetical protein